MSDFEKYAERFYKKYRFLPFGKDDPQRPPSEIILARLGESFAENEEMHSLLKRCYDLVKFISEKDTPYLQNQDDQELYCALAKWVKG